MATEQEIQDSISDLLSGLGFTVLHTNTHGVRGPTGVSKGVPDLLVYHTDFPTGVSIGIEVKKPRGWQWSSYEQWQAWDEKRTVLAFSTWDALAEVRNAVLNLCDPTPWRQSFLKRMRDAMDQIPVIVANDLPEKKKVPPMTVKRRR